MRAVLRTAALVLVLAGFGTGPVTAQSNPNQYSSNEVLDAGHRFFGTVSRGLAQIVEKAGSQWGLPNGDVLGQEAGGAVMAGVRYGDGVLYTKNAGDLRVNSGRVPRSGSISAAARAHHDADLQPPATEAIYQRFVGTTARPISSAGLE